MKLLVQGRESSAMEYAKNYGVSVVFASYNKAQDYSVLVARSDQYDLIWFWWTRGTTLIRTE